MALRILSLGAGVQSTTLALMAARGEIEPPACAIFADTQWEPAAVYRHLEWLKGQVPFPVYRVTAGNLRADIISQVNTTGQRFAAVPWFTLGPKGERGMGRRQCTAEYKLAPIQRKAKELGAMRKAPAQVMLGISTDEAHRTKPSRVQYITNIWPLIDAGLSRQDCLRWLSDHGYPKPPKSACIGCPFHSDTMWRDLRDNHPAEWIDAVEVDSAIRKPVRGFRGEQFMHAQRVPLDQVDLRTHAERGQPDLFGNECEGMCGT